METAHIPKLFLDEKDSDVELHVQTNGSGEVVVIPAHSLVLKKASDVFRAMLDPNKFKEGRSGKIQLTVQCGLQDFISFLRYLYTRTLKELPASSYMAVIQLAHLYEIPEALNICEGKILDTITPISVCRTFLQLEAFATENFKKNCLDLMLRTAFLIFSEDLHLELDEETMKFLLSSSDLIILDEEQALGALWRWGHVQGVPERKFQIALSDVKERIKFLLPLINISVINNVDESSPWFCLWQEEKQNNESETDKPKHYRLVENGHIKYHLQAFRILGLKFAHVFDFRQILSFTENVDTMSANQVVLQFAANCNMIISGFSLQFISIKKLNSDATFSFILNNKPLSDVCILKCELETSWFDFNRIYNFVYILQLEIRNPIAVDKNSTAVFELSLYGNRELISRFPKYEFRVPKPDMPINLQKNQKVLGVRELYYFTRSG